MFTWVDGHLILFMILSPFLATFIVRRINSRRAAKYRTARLAAERPPWVPDWVADDEVEVYMGTLAGCLDRLEFDVKQLRAEASKAVESLVEDIVSRRTR